MLPVTTMSAHFSRLIALAAFAATSATLLAQQVATPAGPPKPKHEDTEFYKPVPPVVTPAAVVGQPPSDAVVLFNGTDVSQWVSAKDDSTPADWEVHDGVMTVKKGGVGNIQTKEKFKDYQLHLEWKIPASITGESQARGNSGVFLASTGPRAMPATRCRSSIRITTLPTPTACWAASTSRAVPLANAARKPGEWSSYDIVWTAPRFNDDGSVKSPAFVTVFLKRRACGEPLPAAWRDVLRGSAGLQEIRHRAHQAAGPRRQERAHQLPQYLGAQRETLGRRAT